MLQISDQPKGMNYALAGTIKDVTYVNLFDNLFDEVFSSFPNSVFDAIFGSN